jgi:hypothetical protein
MVITATSGSVIVGKDSINGATSEIPAGANTTRKIPLTGVVSGANGIAVSLDVASPAGAPVAMNAAQTLTATARAGAATPGTILISAATVKLANQSVSAAPTQFDLSDLSESVVNRAQEGALNLVIANPFNVTGNLTLTLAGAGSPIVKSVALAAGNTTSSIAFTNAELRSILGHNATLSFGGMVNGTTTVTPGQTVTVGSRLELTLSTEESK